MRVSVTTREEAKKLFWSDPSTPYLINGQWLLFGGHPRNTDDDVEVLTYMQHIEVDFCTFGSIFILEWGHEGYLSYITGGAAPSSMAGDHFTSIPEYMESRPAAFWEAFCRRFPRVADVVLTDGGVQPSGVPPSIDAIQLPTESPGGISVSISEDRWCGKGYTSNRRKTRHLWRFKRSGDQSLTWELVD
jgi:hypothetical protein